MIPILLLNSIIALAQDCNLSRTEDKFDKTVMISTPENGFMDVTKIITDETVGFYLTLKVITNHVSSNRIGVYMLFEDGTKWEFVHREVSFSINRPKEYYSYRRLSSKQLKFLMKNRLTDFKLYIYNAEVPEDVGRDFMKQLHCIYNAI